MYMFGVLFPVSVTFLNGFLADKNRYSWNHVNENSVFLYTLLISIIFCVLIAFINYRQEKLSIWYTLSITTGIGLALFLYLGTSLSHFGF